VCVFIELPAADVRQVDVVFDGTTEAACSELLKDVKSSLRDKLLQVRFSSLGYLISDGHSLILET